MERPAGLSSFISSPPPQSVVRGPSQGTMAASTGVNDRASATGKPRDPNRSRAPATPHPTPLGPPPLRPGGRPPFSSCESVLVSGQVILDQGNGVLFGRQPAAGLRLIHVEQQQRRAFAGTSPSNGLVNSGIDFPHRPAIGVHGGGAIRLCNGGNATQTPHPCELSNKQQRQFPIRCGAYRLVESAVAQSPLGERRRRPAVWNREEAPRRRRRIGAMAPRCRPTGQAALEADRQSRAPPRFQLPVRSTCRAIDRRLPPRASSWPPRPPTLAATRTPHPDHSDASPHRLPRLPNRSAVACPAERSAARRVRRRRPGEFATCCGTATPRCRRSAPIWEHSASRGHSPRKRCQRRRAM